MILKPFTAILTHSLDKTEYSLPISSGDLDRLKAQLPPGETTLLVLIDDVYTEEIIVGNSGGQIGIVERGVGETVARKFPRGSAVCFVVTVSVVQYLICNYECCPPEP
jgi:hypothetical protein